MKLWKVVKCYRSGSDVPVYEVLPYNLYGHLKCCYLWYGFKGLKWCYLSRKLADRKARKLNEVNA